METQNPEPINQEQFAAFQQRTNLENRIKNGISWFYWIAGLSMLNTVVFLFGGNLNFVVGLGATQIIDAFMSALAADIGQGGGLAQVIGLVFDVCIAGVFALFGFLGNKRHRWAIILGMILYTLDGIILLFFKDFFGAAFHAWALYGIWNGLKAIKTLKLLETSENWGSIESMQMQIPVVQQPAISPKQNRTRMILVGLIFLVCVVIFIVTILRP